MFNHGGHDILLKSPRFLYRFLPLGLDFSLKKLTFLQKLLKFLKQKRVETLEK